MADHFLPEAFDIIPRSFILPQELQKFQNYQLISGKNAIYIGKGFQGSQGDGIFLFREVRELQSKRHQEIVVQRYVNNPYLVNGFKFDLRLYIVITGINEGKVHAFLADEGCARFCTEKYTPA